MHKYIDLDTTEEESVAINDSSVQQAIINVENISASTNRNEDPNFVANFNPNSQYI